MKCRNLTKDNTGIFFSTEKAYIKAPLVVDITMYASDAMSGSQYRTGQLSFNENELLTNASKSLTLSAIRPVGQNIRITKAVYTVTIDSSTKLVSISCSNQSDVAYGSRMPIRTDVLKLTTNQQTVTIFDSSNKKNGEFDVHTLVPMTRIPAENYVTEGEATRVSIIQRLSIIKGELWYCRRYGLPLLDKLRSKGMFDAFVLKTIQDHPDVTKVKSFNSYVDKHVYTCNVVILTKYGELNVSTFM